MITYPDHVETITETNENLKGRKWNRSNQIKSKERERDKKKDVKTKQQQQDMFGKN